MIPRTASAGVAASCLLVETKFGLMMTVFLPTSLRRMSASINSNADLMLAMRLSPFTSPTATLGPVGKGTGAGAGGAAALAAFAARYNPTEVWKRSRRENRCSIKLAFII
jgi:ABC-type polysaccharide/polyol phosphate export permease